MTMVSDRQGASLPFREDFADEGRRHQPRFDDHWSIVVDAPGPGVRTRNRASGVRALVGL